MEKLSLLNTLRLHSWRIHLNTSDDDLRSTLLLIRNLNIRDFILYTTAVDETNVLNVVSRTNTCQPFLFQKKKLNMYTLDVSFQVYVCFFRPCI